MTRDPATRRYSTDAQETDAAATRPRSRDDGCPHCGAVDAFATVDLADFGLERGQLCAGCGTLVDATTTASTRTAPVAADGGDECADECDCDRLNRVDAGDELACWSCYRRTGGDAR